MNKEYELTDEEWLTKNGIELLLHQGGETSTKSLTEWQKQTINSMVRNLRTKLKAQILAENPLNGLTGKELEYLQYGFLNEDEGKECEWDIEQSIGKKAEVELSRRREKEE